MKPNNPSPDNNLKGKDTKETKLSFSPRQQKLYNFLSQGGKYSVMDIANALYIGDPRSAIRDLRNKGVNVCDEWKSGVEGKYKLYFIKASSNQTTKDIADSECVLLSDLFSEKGGEK